MTTANQLQALLGLKTPPVALTFRASAPPDVPRVAAAGPSALRSQRGVSSLGCIGNRVYTDLLDDEFYYALPGKHLAAVADRLAMIVNANAVLEKYHRARLPGAAASF